ncbi:MAG TPA: AAA family ATPase [Streptosporangiaceae bacterium]|jgi:dephospho-CoA kinase
MTKILVTGMSGTGKSTALAELASRGHRAVDTDTDRWSHWVTLPDGQRDWIWRENEMVALLDGHQDGALFVSGCKSNQGLLYPRFDHIVLLSAPVELILTRITQRNTNPFGKTPAQRSQILADLAQVEPQLRRTATLEIDTAAPLAQVVTRLEALAHPANPTQDR